MTGLSFRAGYTPSIVSRGAEHPSYQVVIVDIVQSFNGECDHVVKAIAGEIPALKIGRVWRFKESVLQRWIDDGMQRNLEAA